MPASFVHNSPSVVPEIPKEMSMVQTAPCGPVKKVLQKCLKVTAAEQSSDFEESECVQKTTESDWDHNSATYTDSFKDLTKDKVVDNEIADVEDTQLVLEITVLTKVISQLNVASEASSSATFEADSPIPVDPSECLIAAPKTLLLQGDLESLTEVPEKRQDLA